MRLLKKQLAQDARQADQLLYQSFVDTFPKEHTFSQEFERKMQELIRTQFQEDTSSPKSNRIHKALAAAAVSFALLICVGITANAMTGGAVWDYIRNLCFGTVDGPHSEFYYVKTDSFSLDGYPDGTYETTVPSSR